MSPGTIFGEMGDILGQPRTYTVRVKTSAEIIHIPEGDMEGLLKETVDLAVKIFKMLAPRFERRTQKLVDPGQESNIWSVRLVK